MTIKSDSVALPAALPWALIGAACLGSFAATSSGTTRAPFLLDMAYDLDVSMPLVANLVSLTSISWGLTSALGGWLSDVVGRRPLLVGALFFLALSVLAQALAGSFFWIAVWSTVGGGCSGAFMGVVFAEVSGRVPDSQRGRALGWVMSGQSLTMVIGVPMAAAVGSLIGWRGWLICVGGLAFAASLSLFSGCSKLLATSDRAGTNTEEIFKSLAKGSYAVKVTTKGVPSDTPYALMIRPLATGLAFVSGSARVQNGSLIVVGEVYNGTSASQAPAVITVKLYDAAGHLLTTRTGRTSSYLPKGLRMPYAIVGSVPAGYARATVTIRGVSTKSILATQALSGITSSYDDSRFRAKGTVTSSVALTTYRVMMTTYNSLGTVVDVTSAGRGLGTLGAHQSTWFDAWSSYAGIVDKASIRSVGVRK